MPFGDDIITQTQAQPGAFACGFGGEKRLEDFVFDFIGDAIAIILNPDFNLIVYSFCVDNYFWFILIIHGCQGFSEHSLKSIVDKI